MPYHRIVRNYRDRAEKLRAIAKDLKNKESKSLLVELATDYDRVAEMLERRRFYLLPSTNTESSGN